MMGTRGKERGKGGRGRHMRKVQMQFSKEIYQTMHVLKYFSKTRKLSFEAIKF